MVTGNKHQSEWSQGFHAGRGSNSFPCPAIGLINPGHAGTCKEAHPRGIVETPSGGWYAMPPLDPDDMAPMTRSYDGHF